MSITIFVFGIIVIHVTAEIPSYIHICNSKESNYNQCITNSINNVKDKVCAGFPEFNISQNEPLTFDKIVIFDTNNIKLYLKDAKLYGFCDYVVNSVHTDRHHFDINMLFPQLYINTTYDFDLHLLVPIANKGPVEIILDNLEFKINLDLKVITKNSKKYIFASKVTANSNVKLFKYNFNDDKPELTELHKIINDVVGKNEEDVVNAVKSVLDERASRFVIYLFNNIAFSNYEKLFPGEI